ncbi:MAG: hypothetical protein ACP5QR_08415 [Rhizomicrobium sp.]
MQMRGVCVLSITALLLTGSAFAAGNTASSSAGPASSNMAGSTVKQATPTAQPQSSTENPHQVICRRSPPPVGSLFGGGTICHTRQQWQQMSQDAQQQLNKMQMIGSNTGG